MSAPFFIRLSFSVFFLLWMNIAFSAVTNTVNVGSGGSSFSPNRITNNVGDSIRFMLVGGTHTVSSNGAPSEPFCGNSPMPSSCLVTFNVAGFFPFRCNFHSGSTATPSALGMTGAVIVVSAAVPPFVAITNPPNNKLFAAPATVAVGIDASDSDGSVANVRLLTNGVFVATNTSAPFGFTLSNLAAGNYTLRARAEDNQALITTSAPVSIRVVTRPFLSFDPGTNGPLQFRFNTVTGVNYVIEGSIALTNFSPVMTNPGSGATQSFGQTNPAPAQRFFRLRLE